MESYIKVGRIRTIALDHPVTKLSVMHFRASCWPLGAAGCSVMLFGSSMAHFRRQDLGNISKLPELARLPHQALRQSNPLLSLMPAHHLLR